MAVKDITSLRPGYLSATLLRDYHYTVFNAVGEVVLVLVTRTGESKAFFIQGPVEHEHKVVYSNSVDKARMNLAAYSRDYTDLLNALSYHRYPPGVYGLSVCDATGKRLHTFEFTLTE